MICRRNHVHKQSLFVEYIHQNVLVGRHWSTSYFTDAQVVCTIKPVLGGPALGGHPVLTDQLLKSCIRVLNNILLT